MIHIQYVLLLLIPGITHAVTPVDVINTINIVAPTMRVPTSVSEMHTLEDPIGVIWQPMTNTCEVYVSKKNIKYIGLMLTSLPTGPMLEGLMAHELAHCIDSRVVSERLGVSSAKKYFAEPATVLQAEILADIMAIMYWKQEYPHIADSLIGGLLRWRKTSAASDYLHYTYPTLKRSLPHIPPVVDYAIALKIRETYK